jgi:GH43 family beta-xylosidase
MFLFMRSYCLGLMSIDASRDPMNISNWKSWPEPVFTSNEEESVFGPGHASFTVSPGKILPAEELKVKKPE